LCLFCDSSSSLPDRDHFPSLFDLLALVFLLPLQCPPLVILIDNVVAVKDRPRLVPGDLHAVVLVVAGLKEASHTECTWPRSG
jgi:hypothetical protein